ncbi:hypothetical protein ABEB36_009583 [Hypothenemus hampei]|uniref:BESS domain-containing protein n=1 Tax=Hypothenemus hampei TaxID=57062 RepID=A0ABD1EH09_HYPHA
MNKELLIDLVFVAPAIWDKRHKNHHNRHILAKEWNNVAAKMKVSGIKRCEKLLEKFKAGIWKANKKKQGRSGDAAVEENDCHWPYFTSLQFLRDQFTPRHMSSSLTDRSSTSELLTQNTLDEDSQMYNESDGENSTIYSLPNVENSVSENHIENQVASTPSTSSSKYVVTQTGYKKGITPQVEIGKQLAEIEKEKLALKANKTKQDLNDEDIGFFNSLLPYVRKLNPRDKLKFRMKIQEHLFELLFPPAPQYPVEQAYQNFPSTSHFRPNPDIYNNNTELTEANSKGLTQL